MRIIPQNPIIRITISAIAAFFGFGAWAYLANSAEGHEIALRSAILQGSLSFMFTFVGSSIMEFMVRLSENNLTRFLLAVVTNLSVVYGFVISSHVINGTPNIFLTILPGLIITVIYCVSYSWFLTYGHAAGGDYKMFQLLSQQEQAQAEKAILVISEKTKATLVEAQRAVEDVQIGRKTSLYVTDKAQMLQTIQQLQELGYRCKPL